MGTSVVYGGDERFHQNIFAADVTDEDKYWHYGTSFYNSFTSSMEEYIEDDRVYVELEAEEEGLRQETKIITTQIKGLTVWRYLKGEDT